MGKIKNFVTGIFSKKDKKEEAEAIRIEPVSEPDREFVENESRYDTPDYQAFLQDHGYVERPDDERNAVQSDFSQDEDMAAEADIVAEETDEIDDEYTIPEADVAAEEEISADTDETDDEDLIPEADEAILEAETAEEDFDQDFIDEAVGELGVNDVWPEEEN